MRIAVLGTGLIGRMIVRELAQSSVWSEVLAVDGSTAAAEAAVNEAMQAASQSATTGWPAVRSVATDLGSFDKMVDFLRDVDIAIAALPDSLSFDANRAAVEAGCHLIDLVGAQYPEKKSALDTPAREADVLVVTGCGLAPGMANVLAARGVELLDEADELMIYCGGLPRHPQPPLMYQQLFSMEGLMGLYTRPVFIVEDGRLVELPPMSGLEDCHFPDPVGACEAAYSDAHSVPYTLGDKVKRLAEKTVRYKGHFGKMKVLQELGFFNEESVAVDGHSVSPRQMTMAVLEPQIQGESKEDITVMRVLATGTKDGNPVRHEWTMVDFFDQLRGYTSMARTTGFPALIVAEWLAKGKLPERGFFAPEQLLVGERFEPFIEELAREGITFNYTASTDVDASAS